MESTNVFSYYAIYEQIVIPFVHGEVLSKEDGSRLNE